MKPEVIEWYANKGFNTKALVNNKADRVRATQLMAAMEWCYENYKGKTIGLGHKTQEIAKSMRDKDEIQEQLSLARSHETAMFYKKKYNELKHYGGWGIGALLWFISLMGFYCYMITVQ